MATEELQPQINGVCLVASDEALTATELRQRACSELLRQAALSGGLLDPADPAPERGVMTAAASDAIETLLERELAGTEIDEASCRRYFEARAASFMRGERVHARHVLFAVTPGVDVVALRKRAEACLLEQRCMAPGTEDAGFGKAARDVSNCPSAQVGGDLGWLEQDDCAPEFSAELFGKVEIGVLPRLVHSRYGLHVVEVLARELGAVPAFEAVAASVRLAMERQGFATALRQYLQILAGEALVVGVDLDAGTGMLVQ